MIRIIEFLKTITLFAGLDNSALRWIYGCAEKRIYDNNNTVIHQGDPGTAIFVVLKGRLKVFLRADDQKEYIFRPLGVGDYFGEISLFGNSKRASYVKTTTRCEVLMFHKNKVMEIINRYPIVSINLLGEVCDRLANTNTQVGSILFSDVRERIRRVIIGLGYNAPVNKVGQRTIEHISITDIANMAGIVRPTASKVVNDFKRKGFIEIKSKNITILDDSFINT